MTLEWLIDADSLYNAVQALEFMFVVREHELLKAAACPEWQPPSHQYRQPRSMAPPQPPDSETLAKLHICLGEDGTLPLAHAVEEVWP